MIDFDKYAKEIHEQNKAVGWWDDPNRNVLETLQLVSTEIAEATEGERKDLMDDHLPHRKMGEVELADALIRMLDIGGRCGIKFRPGCVFVSHEVESKEMPVASMHFLLNSCLVDFGYYLGDNFDSHFDEIVARNCYSSFVRGVVAVAESQGYDIEGAMIEKLEYNRHRADHKRENRAKENGKKF